MRILASLALATLILTDAVAEPKKVIVCTVTTGFRHSSIPYAEKALQKLGEESKAFTVVDSARQPEVPLPKPPNKPGDLNAADEATKAKYEKELAEHKEAIITWGAASLGKLSPANLRAKQIDAVIFANTTGDLPLPDREGFIKWIEDGHAFIGMHSASDTFHGFPGFLDMLQGEFAGHGAQVPADLIAADTRHPANGGIGGKWDIALEEMYLIKHHDRSKLRALWYLRHDPNNEAKVGYHAVSWCRNAGKGRVFYTSLGHREDLWSADPALKDRKNSVEISKQYHAHLLGGISWALGLSEGSAEPNPDAK